MKQYKDLLLEILKNGEQSGDRTGTGTIRIPSYTMKFDMSTGKFPIVTAKSVPFRILAEEMLWMLRGDMDLRSLLQKNIHIWTEWPFQQWVNSLHYNGPKLPVGWELLKNTDESIERTVKELCNKFERLVLTDDFISSTYGDCKPMYGYQWRHWLGVNPYTREIEEMDQLQWAIDEIKTNPNSRRIIVSAWNANQIKYMKLPPCHFVMQFLVINGKLNLDMTQRSCDTFLGVPFNISQYALLLCIVAKICNLEVGTFTHELHDAHIYKNHLEQVTHLLNNPIHELPSLKFNRNITSIDDVNYNDFELVGYEHEGNIKAKVSI